MGRANFGSVGKGTMIFSSLSKGGSDDSHSFPLAMSLSSTRLLRANTENSALSFSNLAKYYMKLCIV